jgi:hypothetical protein
MDGGDQGSGAADFYLRSNLSPEEVQEQFAGWPGQSDRSLAVSDHEGFVGACPFDLEANAAQSPLR